MKKSMKKIISFCLAMVLIISSSTTAFAVEFVESPTDTTFSYYNDDGEIITVSVSNQGNVVNSKVYVDGILTQFSVLDTIDKTIITEIYDLPANARSADIGQTGNMDGFSTTYIHCPVSSERINVDDITVQTRALVDEPVENRGLAASGYGDGYYSLGTYGGFYYAPEVYGHLYRTYSQPTITDAKYYTWDVGTALSVISAYIGALGGPVQLVVSLLFFGGAEYLSYRASIELATYTFNYDYKVRVYGAVKYTAYRNITYWKVTKGSDYAWEQKSFNHGFSMGNQEMVKVGIDNYLGGY